jgi:hypothetical protein
MRFPVLSLPAGALLSCMGACLLLAVACTTVRPVTADELSGPNPPNPVKVTAIDTTGRRSTVLLQAPEVVGDTLFGTENGVRERILLADVNTMSAKQKSPGKTALLVLGAGGAAYLYWAAAVRYTAAPSTSTARCCPNCNTTNGQYNGVQQYTC